MSDIKVNGNTVPDCFTKHKRGLFKCDKKQQ